MLVVRSPKMLLINNFGARSSSTDRVVPLRLVMLIISLTKIPAYKNDTSNFYNYVFLNSSFFITSGFTIEINKIN